MSARSFILPGSLNLACSPASVRSPLIGWSLTLLWSATIGLLCGLTACSRSEPAAFQVSLAEPGSTGSPQSTGHSVPLDDKGQPKFTNALAKETSPYLLMHAHNPVNWEAWNEATLAKAKTEGKPIFLSIGYSSCHWCHVMERESFLDPEIAAFLNEHFICIKVDREERPDIDEIYMQSLMSIRNGGGGWPLSMFLTPDAKPFFGGTYWPARTGDRGAGMGFLTVVQRVHELFVNNREAVERDANRVVQLTQKALAGLGKMEDVDVQKSWAEDALQTLQSTFDPKYGGFGFNATTPDRPKFPEPANLMFLIDLIKRDPPSLDVDTAAAQQMLVTTCERMMMGGIYDHLGGGFHRYSVDRFWKIPHFEKMLYDNGQLVSVYAEAYQLTGRDEFRHVVDGTLAFVERELTSPAGAFYASLDAESEGEEGKFYRWELAEVQAALTDAEFTLFAAAYGLNEAPNFEGQFYAPQLSAPLVEIAQARSLDLSQLETELVPIRKKLFDVRGQRVRPLLDDKILTAWNGLMIRGYADAGRILKRPAYLDSAATAADFLLENLVDGEGRLSRTFTKGKRQLNGYLIDYACLIDGLIGLHQATGEAKWLTAADRLQQKQDALFADPEGGYFYTSSDHEVLIARSKRSIDNVIPAGNSISAGNLLYLADQLKNDAYRQRSKATVLSSAALLFRAPHAAPRMLMTANSFVD